MSPRRCLAIGLLPGLWGCCEPQLELPANEVYGVVEDDSRYDEGQPPDDLLEAVVETSGSAVVVRYTNEQGHPIQVVYMVIPPEPGEPHL